MKLSAFVMRHVAIDDSGKLEQVYYVEVSAGKKTPSPSQLVNYGYYICGKVGKRLFGNIPAFEVRRTKISAEVSE